MINDWKTHSMRRAMMPPGWKDEYKKRRYFEIVLVNKDGQEIGRGYNIEQCVADKARRKEAQASERIARTIEEV
jgi:hypothetical protein